MADESEDTANSEKYWKLATSLSSVVAVIALGWGFNQAQRANQLSVALDTANAQIKAATVEANAQVMAVKMEASEKLQVLTDEANTKLQALSKRDLPVTIGYTSTIFDPEIVAVFKNNSLSALEVVAMLSSAATGQQKEISLVIPANGSTELRKSNGWAFAPGQKIKLSNNEYRSIEDTVRQPK